MMDVKSLALFVLLFIVVLILHVAWAKYRIRQWAEQNRYTIQQCKLCLTNIGPFSYFGTSGGQSVFRIEAETEEGNIRTGYARAGGFFFGLFRKRVEVKWDKSQLLP